MDRSEHIRALQGEYMRRQAQNRAEAEARLREAAQKCPQLDALRARASGIAMQAMKNMMNETDPARRRAIAEKMREDGLANNRALRACLTQAGFPEDYLEEKYRCPLCRDTGYTDELPARFCECFEKALRERMFEDGSMAGLDEQNFACFSENLVRGANRPEDAEYLLIARGVCLRYADSFPDTGKPNLLLYGPGGVGKTFLLNSIYARVEERGLSGVRITAYRLNEAMRKKHIGAEGGDADFDSLIAAPLLLIDDLGTESILRNVTVEYLFTLLNERCAARRHTVVATNLNPANLKERYGERVVSRLTDASVCNMLQMRGADLRQAQTQRR